jgi:hypothetical protein
VSLHEVAAQAIAEPKSPLEIHLSVDVVSVEISAI